LFDIGSGGCDECHKYKSQSVLQQSATSAKLIEAENQELRAAAASAIPLPKSPNKEANEVIRSAQSIHASFLHENVWQNA
jgi:hypothetical protein